MLRRVPVHRTGIRPHLLLGGDRELVLLTGLMCGTLVFAAMSPLPAAIGLALWFVALTCLRLLAKADPRMRGVYLRARRYRAYYPARSTPWRDH